ncbi:L-threonylcarbamoyladenylate synthase [Faecalibacterium gallinarum]|uniref:Threonylcarbamoyl-AMP synthase n=1 Tax=Faecalibacterium gallinarum TaxID=2903556 RepID=A0AA37MYE2_9FIRM|nr:L-threonylcarbamoyladenylate synthase [Faecalibacterium gallinarum]GJN63763.1 threonylcarbamoyl-AMP synthase [Faecalibacterium gallinarum]
MSIETICCAADEAGIARAAALLQQGEIVALPTETVYGIAADARNGAAVAKIFEAKGRPQDNPLIVHIASVEMLPGLVSEFPERARLLAAAFWPGPLTIIMPRGPEVAAECCAGLDTVGIRMPSHPVVQRLIAASGIAFAAPSANLSGKPSPTNAQDVWNDMQGRLPLILDGGECQVGVESTVVSVVGEKPTLFRPGHITLEDLERALGEEVEVSGAILERLAEGEVARSPGMKYKHYAPKADITLLNGSFDQFKAYLEAHAAEHPACLCFTGEGEKLGVPYIEYGREGDGEDQAKHLFRCLRALDEQGDRVVYARCPQKDGLSMAVYNRLIRAAAFRVIDL